MAKKLAKRNLICFAVLAVLLIVLCFVNIGVPSTTSRFVGFANAITKDIDISGSLASKYEITLNDGASPDEINRTVNMLNSKLNAFGYNSGRISLSENEAYIEMPNIKNANSFLQAVAVTGDLYITTATSASSVNQETDVSGNEVNDVNSVFSQTDVTKYAWGVNVNLNNAGLNKIKTMTANANQSSPVTIYIFVGETQISAINCYSQITTTDFAFNGSDSSEDDANITVLKILMGKYEAEFDMVNNQIIETAPLISQNIGTWINIALITLLVLVIVAFFALFGEFGYIITLGLAFATVLVLFFMQAVPIFILSLGGVVGLILGIMLFFISNYIIFSDIKKGYALGKKIPLATKLGFNNKTMNIVDINVLVVIASIAIYLFGGIFAKSLALALAICACVNLFVTLLMTRWFSKWYTKINKDNAEKVHFKREASVNELD